MSLEDRIRSAVDQAVGPLVKQLHQEASADRDAALQEAKVAIYADAEQAAKTRVADAEARVRTMMEEQFVQRRGEEREAVSREMRKQLEGEVEQKMHVALDAAENRMRIALADAEAKAAEELKAAVSAARVSEREIEMSGVSRLLESVRGLDGATSLSEILDALALAASREAARAAVVVMRGERIQGWRLHGFGPRDKQPKSIDLALNDSGVIGHAVGTGRAVTTGDTQTASIGPGFETLPANTTGLAVPVIVGGRVVAVVYADSVSVEGHDRQVPSSWPELIEVLARHAGRCLEALTSKAVTAPRIPTPPGAAAAPNASITGPTNPSTAT
jgi:hypothetical protein